jgi:hypothetical protein
MKFWSTSQISHIDEHQRAEPDVARCAREVKGVFLTISRDNDFGPAQNNHENNAYGLSQTNLVVKIVWEKVA